MGGLTDALINGKVQAIIPLTKPSDVVNPMPPRFTPVTRIVLPRMTAANALATSILSVLSLNSGWVVAILMERFADRGVGNEDR